MRRRFSLSVLLVASAMAISPQLPAAAAVGSNRVALSAEALAKAAAATGGTPMVLTQEACTAALTRELTAHFNLEGELQLELLRAWTPPPTVAANWQLVVSEFPSVASSAMMVRCRLVADGAAGDELTLTLRAALWRDAWVTRQPVTTGTVFDPALLESRRVDLFRDRDALPADVGDQTFLFTRGVNTGRVITWRDIARRPLVRKGDLVEVRAAEGNLSITMKAMALQNGAQGEAVTLRNLESRKDFTAFVVDENHVQVRF